MTETFRRTALQRTEHRMSAVARLSLRSAALLAILCSGAAAAQEAMLEQVRLVVPESRAIAAPVPRQVELFIDFAVVLQISGNVSVVVLGNADIADASVVAAGTIVLTGKAVGATNVLVLGNDGSVLSELHIQVAGHKPGTITIRRALRTSTYACTALSCQYSGNEPERLATSD